MALRQPATAIVTVTLLAAASANAAWADCEQLRQQMIGQYGVVLRYQQGVAVVTPRCSQFYNVKPFDQTGYDQCQAALQNLQASYLQANSTYLQQTANYNAQCTTTATYGGWGPQAPPYANTDANGIPYGNNSATTPYNGLPSATAATPPPDPNYGANSGTFANPTSNDTQTIQQFATPDAGQAISIGIGAFLGGRGGGSRGGGFTKHC